MARAAAIDIATRDFVTVARLRGESAWSVMRRELLPNATSVLLVEFALRAGYAPVLIGSLGFLGFGLRPPTPEWGLMISENRALLIDHAGHRARARPGARLAGRRPEPVHRGAGPHPRPHRQARSAAMTAAGHPRSTNLTVAYRQGDAWLRVSATMSSFTIAPRRSARPGRRIRLRQVDGRPAASRLPPSRRCASDGGEVLLRGPRPALAPTAASSTALRGDRIGFVPQNPTTALNPGIRVGAPDRRDAAPAHGAQRAGQAPTSARRALRPGRPAGADRVAAALSAPALGRPAAARLHRDGARLRARPRRARRADDRPRRHHAGADRRAAGRSPRAARHCRCST